ncbi:NAD(+) synthase [Singulisphaera acidiphila]|uniref:Glutamine-dependent NAD(+) synthetase n=1 Tax=Singulisphaera acidiphila (strain ATCC BAA-1392 / DSM 18658 / VKM B-2454 / MOB10) TaxID=886293 RepID=L0DJ13_SINAD|nr:NAD(+) synthase [Singulisphaera acidiphila]AGA28835.1 NAD synthase [Singulisphaera acidiphila DSM 18658]
MNRYGFVRITTASTKTAVANPMANADEMVRILDQVRDSDVILFPELGVTGYTCADLFGQTTLLEAGLAAVARIAEATRGREQLVVVGLPVAVGNSLYNCGVAIADGAVIGIVPKQFIPNYKEFYESRWFSSATGAEPRSIDFGGREVPFGIDLLFAAEGGALVGIEVCEDLWMPIPPSSVQAVAGANLLLNLSASNETIGKSRYRTELVVGQSGRCIAAYAYSSAGPSESTTDLVFGGHCLIAENGALLGESPRVGDGGTIERGSYFLSRDVDIEKLQTDRRSTTSFDDCRKYLSPFRKIPFRIARGMSGLARAVAGTPFVPSEGSELHGRCAEIFGIQCAGLAKRLEQLPAGTPLNIGISGGLDSTLALLVAVKTCDMLGVSRCTIHGITMPGFGTTQRTKTNALDLMEQLGITGETIDITELSLQSFHALGHAPFGIDTRTKDVESFMAELVTLPPERRHDLTFENVQARLRTFLLMSRGFVIGTGDLSEQALGWSTYNGDHMSMYNPNCSIPKTLVTFLVRYAALNEFEEGPVRETLLSIVGTTISPELLPLGAEGQVVQSTEDILGPYELIDFILYNAIRCGYTPEKILFLAEHATFTKAYTSEQIERALRTFYTRFFSQQFKRSCVPDGPKVGSVSLSPRGDWRMPSDADPSAWLQWARTR